MKRVILTGLSVLALATTVFADAFQFVRQNTKALVVGAAIHLDGKLIGYTNDQGIIFITSPQGTNTFLVSYRDQTTRVDLNITGNPQLQVVPIQ
jgi:hypothetical protein